MPAAEDALQAGDLDLARDIVPRSMSLPELRSFDSWAMRLWFDMRSELLQGSQVALLRWKCERQRMSEPQQNETLERVLMIDRVIAGYRAELAEAERKSRAR